jgi:hypothetical protein
MQSSLFDDIININNDLIYEMKHYSNFVCCMVLYSMGGGMKETTFLNNKRRSFEFFVMLVIIYHVDKYLKITILEHCLYKMKIGHP